MSKRKKDIKYPFVVRLLGLSCTLLFIGCVLFLAIAGFSLTSGFLMAASIAGIIAPSIAANEGVLETFVGAFELIIEGIQTIFEIFFAMVSSIFG